MKRRRHIVCAERTNHSGQYSDDSLWVIPSEMDWTSNQKSFDLLGTTHEVNQLNQYNGSERTQGECGQFIPLQDLRNDTLCADVFVQGDYSFHLSAHSPDSKDGAKSKLAQLLHAMWLVFDYKPMTIDQGIAWLGKKIVKRLAILAEVFELLERKQDFPINCEMLWTHCLRTGYLAGLLAGKENGDFGVMSESCQAGFFHDIGLAILALSHESDRYLEVLAYSRQRGVSLARAELLNLGVSHEMVGAEFLQRQKFPQTIVDAVSFHDNPLGLEKSVFTPTIAVYAANILDGGGWPQDSDGAPSDHAQEYLASRGFVDPWQNWQRYVAQIRNQGLRRA